MADGSTFDHVHVVLNTVLFSIANTPITLSTLLLFGFLLLGTVVCSRFVRHITLRAFHARGIEDEGTIGVTQRLLHYTIVLLGLGVALQTIGIDLGALFAAGAVAAVAIGFAMQSIVQNFVSGVILLVERSIRPGDILTLDGHVVRIKEMGIRATIVQSPDDEHLIVPNLTLVQSVVKNSTFQERTVRIKVSLGVSYASDLDEVLVVLQEAANKVEGRAVEHEPAVLLVGFGDSSVNFEVFLWIHEPWRAPVMRSALSFALWRALKAHNIEMPFPQLDLYVKEVPQT